MAYLVSSLSPLVDVLAPSSPRAMSRLPPPENPIPDHEERTSSLDKDAAGVDADVVPEVRKRREEPVVTRKVRSGLLGNWSCTVLNRRPIGTVELLLCV